MPSETTGTPRPSRSARISVSLTQEDKAALDERARAAGIATGLLVSLVIREYLREPEVLPAIAAPVK